MTLLLDFTVIDPTQSLAFPMNVIALLPYMVQNYEDANELCITIAENIAQVNLESPSTEHKKYTHSIGNVRFFSPESAYR